MKKKGKIILIHICFRVDALLNCNEELLSISSIFSPSIAAFRSPCLCLVCQNKKINEARKTLSLDVDTDLMEGAGERPQYHFTVDKSHSGDWYQYRKVKTKMGQLSSQYSKKCDIILG